ncbi:hypothetical protein LINPERHAP1_LOCUS14355 [Linum perenne]
MDAVKFNHPVEFAAAGTPNLSGSEGVGRDRVAGLGVGSPVNPTRALNDSREGSSVNVRNDSSKHINSGKTNGQSWLPKCEEVHADRKAGRVSRGGAGCAKRPMASPAEDGAGLTGIDDSKNSSDKLGSFLKSCDSHGNSSDQMCIISFNWRLLITTFLYAWMMVLEYSVINV